MGLDSGCARAVLALAQAPAPPEQRTTYETNLSLQMLRDLPASNNLFALLETEGWRYSSDTGWTNWDVQIYGNFWWIVKLRTVTEYHGGPKCLTRVRLGYKMVVTTFLANVIAISALVYRHTFAHDRHYDTSARPDGVFCVYARA